MGSMITVVEFWAKQATEGSCLMRLFGLRKRFLAKSWKLEMQLKTSKDCIITLLKSPELKKPQILICPANP